MPLIIAVQCLNCEKKLTETMGVSEYYIYAVYEDDTEKVFSHPGGDSFYYGRSKEALKEFMDKYKMKKCGMKICCYNTEEKQLEYFDLENDELPKHIVTLDKLKECECPFCGEKKMAAFPFAIF